MVLGAQPFRLPETLHVDLVKLFRQQICGPAHNEFDIPVQSVSFLLELNEHRRTLNQAVSEFISRSADQPTQSVTRLRVIELQEAYLQRWIAFTNALRNNRERLDRPAYHVSLHWSSAFGPEMAFWESSAIHYETVMNGWRLAFLYFNQALTYQVLYTSSCDEARGDTRISRQRMKASGTVDAVDDPYKVYESAKHMAAYKTENQELFQEAIYYYSLAWGVVRDVCIKYTKFGLSALNVEKYLPEYAQAENVNVPSRGTIAQHRPFELEWECLSLYFKNLCHNRGSIFKLLRVLEEQDATRSVIGHIDPNWRLKLKEDAQGLEYQCQLVPCMTSYDLALSMYSIFTRTRLLYSLLAEMDKSFGHQYDLSGHQRESKFLLQLSTVYLIHFTAMALLDINRGSLSEVCQPSSFLLKRVRKHDTDVELFERLNESNRVVVSVALMEKAEQLLKPLWKEGVVLFLQETSIMGVQARRVVHVFSIAQQCGFDAASGRWPMFGNNDYFQYLPMTEFSVMDESELCRATFEVAPALQMLAVMPDSLHSTNRDMAEEIYHDNNNYNVHTHTGAARPGGSGDSDSDDSAEYSVELEDVHLTESEMMAFGKKKE